MARSGDQRDLIRILTRRSISLITPKREPMLVEQDCHDKSDQRTDTKQDKIRGVVLEQRYDTLGKDQVKLPFDDRGSPSQAPAENYH